MNNKTERLKKLETELKDLKDWMKLGLVPKGDLPKHKEEIATIQAKIGEEKDRIQFLKDNGELDELYATRKTPTRNSYSDNPTISDINITEHDSSNDMAADSETDSIDVAAKPAASADEDTEVEETDWEDPYSDRARWQRGMLDPSDDSWE